MNVQASHSEWRIVRKLFHYVYRYKKRCLLAFACSLIVSVLTVASLSMMKPTVETIFQRETLGGGMVSSLNESPGQNKALIRAQGEIVSLLDESPGQKKALPWAPGKTLIRAPGTEMDNAQGQNITLSRASGALSGDRESAPDVGIESKLREVMAPFYRMLDTYAADSPLGVLAIVFLVFILLSVLNGAFRYTQEYMINWVGNRALLDLQRDLFSHMLGFNTAYFSRTKVGSILSYYTVDVRVIGLSLFNILGRLMIDPCIVLVLIVTLFWMQWQLTLLYGLIFPVLAYTVRYFAKKNRRAGRSAQDVLARLNAFLQEHFSFIQLVQGYGMDAHQRSKFWRETRGVFSASMSMVKAKAASSPINEVIGLTGMCVIIFLGAYMIFERKAMAPSDFLVYIAFMWSLYQPCKRIERSFQEIQHGFAAAERVLDVLERDESLPVSPNPVSIDRFDQEIRFDNVSFSYDGERPVLDRISFEAKKGELVALVGPSGAGKTTIVNLIPRFYDPLSGSILLDGNDLRSLDLQSLRCLIAFVPQDVAIFGDTARVNITCGDERYTDTQVKAAAKAAYADEFIENLPQGYDTIVGERGAALSGGQCQRLALARAFLRDSPILILDEATSSLDSESERRIKLSIEKLMKGRTALVIAHRLSTILHADRIVVVDKGSVVDIGSHSELLKRCSLYQRLYQLQFAEEGDDVVSMGPGSC